MNVRDLSIFGAYFAQFLKARMAYRADFFADVAATALRTFTSLLFVFVLFVPIDSLAGWERDEIVFIYGLSMVPYGMFATVSWNLYDFGDKYVIEGHFDRVLLRPLNSFLQVVFESFRVQTLAESAIGLVVVLAAAASLDLTWTWVDAAWLLVACVSGAVLFVSVFGIIASLSFHFEDRIGIAPPVFNLINAGRYPVEIFHPVLRFLLRWVVPFSFVAFYPSTSLLGRDEFRRLCFLSPVVALVFVLLLAVAWTLGVRRYASTGS
ncbi:MAG: ABC transporter permease [Planctomycetota bacterium JB042]